MRRRMQVTYATEGRAVVPMLRLRGKWLQAAGFEFGALVEVLVANGQLMLIVATRPQARAAEPPAAYPTPEVTEPASRV